MRWIMRSLGKSALLMILLGGGLAGQGNGSAQESFIRAGAPAVQNSQAEMAAANPVSLPARQSNPVSVEAIDRSGQAAASIHDGDTLRLRVSGLANNQASGPIHFVLLPGETFLGECGAAEGANSCTSEALLSLGWYWLEDGAAAPLREVAAMRDGVELARIELAVQPRPVVMVHGFISSAAAWQNYLGPQGFLAGVGIAGYAVGDGQTEGAMNTGSLSGPDTMTNTIAENAAILGETVRQVKELSGAEMVDLLAHSMGGLISRYYIDRLMDGREVGQLMMLGSPMLGTACANLPASLGLYLPATLEIRPSYVSAIFNRQVYRQHGVPFAALAGDQIQDPIQSPCTSTPTDLAVSLESVNGIPLEAERMGVLHTELNTSVEVFASFVLPRLQRPAGEWRAAPDPSPLTGDESLQFSQVYTGRVEPGGAAQVTIPLEEGLALANFALFDPTRSLTVTVQGASGNVIDLDPTANGLVQVDDPSSLVYLGYAFAAPRPGSWVVTVQASERTPAGGAEYALTAHYTGGAALDARLEPLLPVRGETVTIQGELSLNGQALTLDAARLMLRGPDGRASQTEVQVTGSTAEVELRAGAPGLYAADLLLQGHGPAGQPIERTAFLSFEVQPEPQPAGALIILVIAAGTVLLAGLTVLLRRRKRSR